MSTALINTVSAYRSLLKEDDYALKALGVKKLLQHITTHWTDIANDILEIDKLATDRDFPDPPLAALLMSKLLFYLGEYDRALEYALLSKNYFKVGANNDEFTETLANKCIEKYIASFKDGSKSSNHEYKQIVDFLIETAISKGEIKLPLGIALETEDLTLLKQLKGLMEFSELVQIVLIHLPRLDLEFRTAMLAEILQSTPTSFKTAIQYINFLQLAEAKGDYKLAAKLIYECLRQGNKELAFTLALEVSEMHGFNRKVFESIPQQTEHAKEYKELTEILNGTFSAKINNFVLQKLAHTDPYYRTQLKGIENKYSIAHGSAIMSLSLLQAYTQDHSFLKIKENMEWAAKCTHWNKFSSIASLGLIYKNSKNRQILQPFLPGAQADPSTQYSSGGSLYGLGLLYMGTWDQGIIAQITNYITNPSLSQNDIIMHGACLGLGLVGFGSGDPAVGQRLKDILHSSTSVMGQASALALGLVYAGTNDEDILAVLISMAKDTEYEKIVRSICISIGLICFKSPSSVFLRNLESNSELKGAIPFYLACAYFQSSSPQAIRKLLALSNDISNQVRRNSIIALGFVLYRNPKLIDIVKLMIYSYNPHVRYGCAMALAVGGRDQKEVYDLIWPLLNDYVDFVRQGAFISLSLLLQLTTPNSDPKYTEFKKHVNQTLARTHEQIMVKMGAILSVGLVDIGGRNMGVSLTTQYGFAKIEAIAGLLVFTQFWNWFPYLNFIGLAISPSSYIGITGELNIPETFQLKSNCKLSQFDYPANIKIDDKKTVDKKETVKQLSTTTRAKARAIRKKDTEMEAEPALSPKKTSIVSRESLEEKPSEKPEEAQKIQEESFTILNNPVRILRKQHKVISFVEGRYTPTISTQKAGINFLKDSRPQESDTWFYQVYKPVTPTVAPPAPVPSPTVNTAAATEVIAPPEDFDLSESSLLLPKKQ